LKTALWLLMAGLFSHGCSSPPPSPDQESGASVDKSSASAPSAQAARANPGQWPCDHTALDSPHCRLQTVEGFQRRADPDSMRFEDIELDATLTARIIRGPKGAGVDGQAQQIMEAWQAKLSPTVTWDQDPQGPVGFEVRGISGSESSSLTAAPWQTPQQFHVVSYRNPRTGSILLLEASAPQTHWQQAWLRMAPVFAAVRLTEAF